jgi:CRISPR-associated protein Cmr3
MRIFIEPTEPLLFRTGRPFTAGENTFAESIFPPTPETLQGALRAAIAVHWGKEQNPPIRSLIELFQQDALVQLVGERTDERETYGQFRITSLTPGRRNPETQKIERLFPAPSHILHVTLKDGVRKKFRRLALLQPKMHGAATTPTPSAYLLFPDMSGYTTAGKAENLTGWLTPLGLRAVLQGDLPREHKSHLLKNEDLYTREPRLGIGMQDEKKTTREGYLYQVQMIRMQPWYGFVVDIAFGEQRYGAIDAPSAQEQRTDTPQTLAFLKKGWLTLGGEQRAAHFTVLGSRDIAEEDMIASKQQGNLVYFATPAYFRQGWLPEDLTLFPAQPITAALHHYQLIGGWYLNTRNAGGGSKSMRRCVPAGSAYFFDQPITIQRPLTEYGWQIGYGITYTGEWKP